VADRSVAQMDALVMSHHREVVPVLVLRNEVFEQMACQLDLSALRLVLAFGSHFDARGVGIISRTRSQLPPNGPSGTASAEWSSTWNKTPWVSMKVKPPDVPAAEPCGSGQERGFWPRSFLWKRSNSEQWGGICERVQEMGPMLSPSPQSSDGFRCCSRPPKVARRTVWSPS
jgi:hypothetical protein